MNYRQWMKDWRTDWHEASRAEKAVWIACAVAFGILLFALGGAFT